MKERPILFSTAMVQAILAGLKTQTRRIMKTSDFIKESDNPDIIPYLYSDFPDYMYARCPYGKPGDILWVRETYKPGSWRHEEYKAAFDYKASPELTNTQWCHFEDETFEKLILRWIDELDKKGFEPEINELEETFSYKWNPGWPWGDLVA